MNQHPLQLRTRIFRPICFSLLAALGLLVSTARTAPGSGAQSPAPATSARHTSLQSARAEAEIRAVLDAQVADWNAKRLEGFMEGYWRSPELTFFSGGRKLAGWEATLERYRRTYQAEGREMGRLAFSDLDITLLSETAAVVRGRWELTMPDGAKPGGLYTLIFRRLNQGWKIVHDHTSSNE
jgi:ketosteroid isomerase-like protein